MDLTQTCTCVILTVRERQARAYLASQIDVLNMLKPQQNTVLLLIHPSIYQVIEI